MTIKNYFTEISGNINLENLFQLINSHIGPNCQTIASNSPFLVFRINLQENRLGKEKS